MKTCERKLSMLDCHGVNNWVGYGEAMSEYYSEGDDSDE